MRWLTMTSRSARSPLAALENRDSASPTLLTSKRPTFVMTMPARRPDFIGRAGVVDVGDEDAFAAGDPEGVAEIGGEILQLETEAFARGGFAPGTFHPTGAGDIALLHEFPDGFFNLRGGNGEADALGGSPCGVKDILTELRPTRWPPMSISGPPELPGLMAASVWIRSL